MIYALITYTVVLIIWTVVNTREVIKIGEMWNRAADEAAEAYRFREDAKYWYGQAKDIREDALRMIELCDTTDDSEGVQDSAPASSAPAPTVVAVDSPYDMWSQWAEEYRGVSDIQRGMLP